MLSTNMSMFDLSLLDTVIATFAVLVTMAIISCLCCVCIKLSDMKLKHYIMEMSHEKGVPVDIEKLELKPAYKRPMPDEPCAIVVPDLDEFQERFKVVRKYTLNEEDMKFMRACLSETVKNCQK